MHLTFDPAMSHWESILKKGKPSCLRPGVCMLEYTYRVITTSSTVAKIWNQPEYPLIGEWLNKSWYIHTSIITSIIITWYIHY